jgi:hypothetical protein
METLLLATFTLGVVYYAHSVFTALRDGDIETIQLIGRGSVHYSRSGQPLRYGCATIAHAAVVVALVGGVVMLVWEVPAGDWTARPTATVARVARAALAHAPEPAAGYREHGGLATDALRAALGDAIAAERRRLALPPALGLSATVAAVAALFVARELTGFTWTYAGVAALLGIHTLVSSLRFQRELTASTDALAHALSRAPPPD